MEGEGEGGRERGQCPWAIIHATFLLVWNSIEWHMHSISLLVWNNAKLYVFRLSAGLEQP